jgi:hypothetical protein
LWYRYLINKNVTLQIPQEATTHTTVKTHQYYQHITTVPLCCVSKCGNKLAHILLTTVAPICEMVQTKVQVKWKQLIFLHYIIYQHKHHWWSWKEGQFSCTQILAFPEYINIGTISHIRVWETYTGKSYQYPTTVSYKTTLLGTEMS